MLAPTLQDRPTWLRPRRVPLGEDDALDVLAGIWPMPGHGCAVVLAEGEGGRAERPVLTRYFEHVANQLRWQLPWLARVTGRSLVRPVSWYQWQAQTSRAGTAWPARISRVVLAEHQGVYRYASWREVNAPWEAALIEALHPQASRGHTRP